MDLPVFQDPELCNDRHAAVLERYFVPEEFEASGLIYVKATPESKETLELAGYRRIRMRFSYSIRVVRDASGRLSVAAVQN